MSMAESEPEAARGCALPEYAALDTGPEEVFDDLTRLVSRLLRTPIALIRVAERDRQWFKSTVGLSVSETPRAIALCDHAIRSRHPLIVPDVQADERFAGTPPVMSESRIRFYAGVPLVTPDGDGVGTLSVIDYVPRELSPAEIETLRLLGRQVITALELRRHGAALERSLAASEARRRIAEAIAEVGRVVAQSFDPEKVARQIAESLRSILAVGSSAVYRLHRDGGAMVALAVSRVSEASFEWDAAVEPGTGAVGVAARERRAIVTPDVLSDPRLSYSAEGRRRLESSAHLAVLAVPLLIRGTVIGALAAGDVAGRVFDEQAIGLAEAVAAQTALALAALDGAESASRALRASEERYRALVDHAPDVVIRFDKALRHVYANAAAQRAGGLPPEALAGKTHRQLGLPESLCELWETALQKVFESGQETVIEFDATGPGPIRSFEARLAPEHGSDGSVETVLAVSRDISGRRLMEEQLRQSQRMEAVGKLAGGVAHDFNNLLTVIQGRAEIVRSKLGAAHLLRRDVELIHTAAERGAMLTQQLLAFSRKQVLKPKVLGLATVVDGMASVLRRVIGEDIDLRIQHRERGAYVEADPGQIGQLIMNLAVNARDAMPNGGRLTIATAAVDLDAAAAKRHLGLPPGPYVSLSVSDTGCGMDAETRAHLFEPFFTIKERGKGTGLGLSTVYGIVQQHGGSIVVESEVGCGSAFVVLLPQPAVLVSELSATEDANEPPRGGPSESN